MHHFTEKGDLGLCYFLLQYLYQARKVSGNVHVLEISIIPLFLQFSIRILELFRQCGKFFFFFLTYPPPPPHLYLSLAAIET